VMRVRVRVKVGAYTGDESETESGCLHW
jgi:hypothetical protein